MTKKWYSDKTRFTDLEIAKEEAQWISNDTGLVQVVVKIRNNYYVRGLDGYHGSKKGIVHITFYQE